MVTIRNLPIEEAIMDLHYEYSTGEEKASAWVQNTALLTMDALQAIEEELARVRAIEPRIYGPMDKANIRGYMDGLAREYVALQELR